MEEFCPFILAGGAKCPQCGYSLCALYVSTETAEGCAFAVIAQAMAKKQESEE